MESLSIADTTEKKGENKHDALQLNLKWEEKKIIHFLNCIVTVFTMHLAPDFNNTIGNNGNNNNRRTRLCVRTHKKFLFFNSQIPMPFDLRADPGAQQERKKNNNNNIYYWTQMFASGIDFVLLFFVANSRRIKSTRKKSESCHLIRCDIPSALLPNVEMWIPFEHWRKLRMRARARICDHYTLWKFSRPMWLNVK